MCDPVRKYKIEESGNDPNVLNMRPVSCAAGNDITLNYGNIKASDFDQIIRSRFFIGVLRLQYSSLIPQRIHRIGHSHLDRLITDSQQGHNQRQCSGQEERPHADIYPV